MVEDDYDVAESLKTNLAAAGCKVVGPVSTSEAACALVRHDSMDVALLDIALSPGTSAPVARALLLRGCPFAFVTGYSNLDFLPDELRGYRVLLKPVDRETLCSAIYELVAEKA